MLQQSQSPLNQWPRNTHSIIMGLHSFGCLQSAESLVISKPKMNFVLVVDLSDLNSAEGTQAWPEKDWVCAVLTQHQTSHLNAVALSLLVFSSHPLLV